jgi:ABC-type transport system substrate-binding protein
VGDGYWQQVLRQRLTRRRALIATAAGAAAFLAACGGSEKGGKDAAQKDVSGLVVKAVDETKSAKKGGVYKTRGTFEPNTLDPHQFPFNFYSNQTYSNLWRIKDGVIDYSSGEVEGDLVESWEVSPDKLQITAKINPSAHFAPVAPVNGRAVDAKDVVTSWERHKGSSNQRADFANEVNPAAPISSMTATDDRTVIIKLAEPNAVVTARLARATPGSMYILPKEAADPKVLDVNRTSIGSGPFYVSEFTPSVIVKLKKNPGYKQDKRDLPYLDELEYPTVQEYATFLSQFKAGSIYDGVAIRSEDILPTKRDVPALEIMQTYFSTRIQRVGFGMATDSLFKDERLRQAWVLPGTATSTSAPYSTQISFAKPGSQWTSSTRAASRRIPTPAGFSTRGARTSARTRSSSPRTSPKRRSCWPPPGLPTALTTSSSFIQPGPPRCPLNITTASTP